MLFFLEISGHNTGEGENIVLRPEVFILFENPFAGTVLLWSRV